MTEPTPQPAQEQPTPPPSPATKLDGDQSRRDGGVVRSGFKKWLLMQKRAGNPQGLEFVPLWGLPGMKWPVQYKFEDWADLITIRWPDRADEVIEYMVRAEAMWRAEQVTSELTADAYGIAPQTMANKLTYRTAQPDTKCRLKFADGKECGREVIPGSNRCEEHGGALVDPETRRAILLSSYASLVSASQVAVDTLVDVAQHSRNDLARVSASKEILDRVGLTPDLNINVSLEGEGSSPVDKIRRKLDSIAERLNRAQPIEATLASPEGEGESEGQQVLALPPSQESTPAPVPSPGEAL